MKLWSSLGLVGLLIVCMDPVLIVLIQPAATGSGINAIKLNPMKKVCGLMHNEDRLNISGTITIPQDQISESEKLSFFNKCSIDLNKCECPQQQDCYCSAKKDDDFSFIVNTMAVVDMKEQPFELTYGGKTFSSNEKFPMVYQKLSTYYWLNNVYGDLQEMQTKIVDSAVNMTLCNLNLEKPTTIMTINGNSTEIKDGCQHHTISPPTTVTVVYTETVGCKRNASYTVKLLRGATLTKAGGGADDLTMICGKVTKPWIFKKDGHKIVAAEGMEISGAFLTIKQADARNHLGSYTCESTDSARSSPVVITQSKLTGCTWDGKTTLTCVKNSTEEGRKFSYKLDGKTISGTETTLEITEEGKYTCKSKEDDFDSEELEFIDPKKEECTSYIVPIVVLACINLLGLIAAIAGFVYFKLKNKKRGQNDDDAQTAMEGTSEPSEGTLLTQEQALSLEFSEPTVQDSWFWPFSAPSTTTEITARSKK